MKIIDAYRKFRDKWLLHKRSRYFVELRELTKGASIISSNCFAGRIMQDLEMEYNSPTLGLYFFAPDYIKFLENLRHNLLESTLTFVNESKYELGNQRRNNWPFAYPIGLLDGVIEIHFLHYHSEKEAKEKWERRAKRVNFDNLIVIGMQQNECTNKEISEFDALPFKRKIFFSASKNDCPSSAFIPEFQGRNEVGDPYKKGHIFYKYLIKHFAQNK